jgi:Spy/CpxP family protein refolding chaperone
MIDRSSKTSSGLVVGAGGLCGLAAFPTMAVGGRALAAASSPSSPASEEGGGTRGDRSLGWFHGQTSHALSRAQAWVERHKEVSGIIIQ